MSRSPSSPLAAKKQPSPATSSTSSNGASAKLAAAALSAADATFGNQQGLPLHKRPSPAHASAEGRRRLGGAFLIARSRIQPDPNQPRRRLDTEAQRELVDSIKRLGILQPITVRYIPADDKYQIITGERRFHASGDAGLEEIPCWVQEPKDSDVLLHQIVENWQRLDMHPYDLADALARLRDAYAMTQAEIAKSTGKSEGEISKLLSLLTLDPDVQKAARDDETGHITKSHLYAVKSLAADKQRELVTRVAEKGISVEDLEKIAARQLDVQRGIRRRGAPVSHHRFTTTHARVSLTFRRKDITSDDILAALAEVRHQVEVGNRDDTRDG